MQLVRDLRRYAEVRNESMDSDMQAIQSVLTPKQIAKVGVGGEGRLWRGIR